MDPAAAAPTPAELPGIVEPAPVLNKEKIKSLGSKLASDFQMYEKDRRLAELQWTKNLRQYLGKYDDEVDREIPKDKSRAYPKLTRVKVVSMVSRLMNLLFPSSEKCWEVGPSPVPNLSAEDLTTILEGLQQDPNAEVTDATITNAVLEFARERARNLETEIADQLTELGGAKTVSFISLCRRVLMSGVMYGAGVLKGPLVRSRAQRRWQLNQQTNKVEALDTPILIPQFQFTPLWDYYPDMSAKYLHQMDGQFERIVMSRTQVRKLADNSEFFEDQILTYLKDHQQGNYKPKAYESEVKSLGVHNNTPQNDRKYEVIVWDGAVSGHYLKGCGLDIPEAKLADMHQAIVWSIDDTVIRANLNPWAMLGEDNPLPSYHVFIFEEDESALMGNGLPQIMRDSQLGTAAATRMILDNAGVVCGDMVEVNTQLLRPDQDLIGIFANKIWYRDDESPQTVNTPAVRSISMNSHLDELLKVNDLFRNNADQETFVNPATGGDMQKGPSEPFRTAAGASMIQGQAALPFKDVVRAFDVFTESVIGSLIVFNKHFNQKPSIKGDFQAIARGSTSLIAKEVRGMAADDLARSVTPGEAIYVDWYELLKERVRVRDMSLNVVVDEAEKKRREEAQAADAKAKDVLNTELIRSEIRKTLAEAVKNLSQSDKNAAGAEAVRYDALLSGLEKGVTPAEVADARVGGPVPDGVAAMHEIKNPPKPELVASTKRSKTK